MRTDLHDRLQWHSLTAAQKSKLTDLAHALAGRNLTTRNLGKALKCADRRKRKAKAGSYAMFVKNNYHATKARLARNGWQVTGRVGFRNVSRALAQAWNER